MQLPDKENSEIRRILWASAELYSAEKWNRAKRMQLRRLKDKLAPPPFDTYLAEDSIGQQSDNIEHHLWFLSIPAFCQIIVDYSSLYYILVSIIISPTSNLNVPSSVSKPFSNQAGSSRPQHWAPFHLHVDPRSLTPSLFQSHVMASEVPFPCVLPLMWSKPLHHHLLKTRAQCEHVTRGLPSSVELFPICSTFVRSVSH